MNKLSVIKIVSLFLVWRAALFLIAFFSTIFITNFGGRFPYYKNLLISTGLPAWIWGFGNFDGVHYLNIAQFGYMAEYSQSFFPAYPLLIKIFSFGRYYFLSGMFISNILFLFCKKREILAGWIFCRDCLCHQDSWGFFVSRHWL